jgi:hypothetical protein
MRQSSSIIRQFIAVLLLLWPLAAVAGEFERFAGSFMGEAEFMVDGEVQHRDMSTTITPTKNGVRISWTSISRRSDGRVKTRTYNILFEPSGRKNIYSSAMRTNVFGKDVPLNPLKGEPYVWARLIDDTLSVFSLVIDETGEYEMQEYHRTLVAEGLALEFIRLRNGGALREIRTLLHRID